MPDCDHLELPATVGDENVVRVIAPVPVLDVAICIVGVVKPREVDVLLVIDTV